MFLRTQWLAITKNHYLGTGLRIINICCIAYLKKIAKGKLDIETAINKCYKAKKTQLPESCLELLNLFDRDIMPSFEVF